MSPNPDRFRLPDDVTLSAGAAVVRLAADDRAPLLMMKVGAERRLEEHRRAHRPVERAGRQPDAVVVLLRVVEAGDGARMHLARLLVLEELEAAAQGWRRLVVDTDDRLVAQKLHLGSTALVVVRLTGRRVDIGRGPPLQDIHAALIETARRNPTQHASVLEAGPGVGRRAGARDQRILDVRVEISDVVARLREIALTLEQASARDSGSRHRRTCAGWLRG